MTESRVPGFRSWSIDERRALIADALGIGVDELERRLLHGGLTTGDASHLVENVFGTFAFPLSVAMNVKLNGEDRLVPMCVEEPSVVAAASHAAKLARASGGFHAEADPPIMIGQVQFEDIEDATRAIQIVEEHTEAWVSRGNALIPQIVRYGGGLRAIETRDLGDGMFVIHLLVDCADAMGANTVNTLAEALSHDIHAAIGGRLGLRILSNLADRRLVRVRCAIAELDPAVREGVARASRFAERDPYRAATHNKGIMNGVDAVVLATGNDWRAVEAGAHSYAARSGVYRPLCRWWEEDETLCGELEMPMALGTVSGFSRVHPAAALALELSEAKGAQDLAMLVATAGMASNLAALRALSTEGIQRGHMLLHARGVAIAAGAGDRVAEIASRLHADGDITIERAKAMLDEG